MKKLLFQLLVRLAVIASLAMSIFAGRPVAAAEIQGDGAQYAIPPAQSDCSYAAHFVADVTVPDDTVFAAGTPFVKTWRNPPNKLQMVNRRRIERSKP